MRKRFLTIVMSFVLIVSMITGCGNSKGSDSSSESSQSSASVEESSNEDASSNTGSDSSSNSDNSTNNDTNANSDESEYTVYGKVTKVSDGKVTYEVLEKDSSKPQMPQGSGASDAKNGEKPHKPQGSGTPDMRNGDGIPGFKSTGKKSTVIISGSVTVQKSGMDQTKTDASVSDIKKGSIIGLAFDGDNVTKILIRVDNGKMGKPADNNNSGNTQNSSDNSNSNN